MSPPNDVQAVMTRKVVSVEPETPVLDAVGKLHAYRISCLLVCAGGAPIGIITERDVVGLAYQLLRGSQEIPSRALDLMSSPVLTVRAGDSIEHAAEMVREHRVRHLPVVDEAGELVGLLTQTDLFRAGG